MCLQNPQGRRLEYYSTGLELMHEPSGIMSQHMPYISRLKRKKQQQQNERARWMGFTDAIKHVQEKENCTAENAAQQLLEAIIDGELVAQSETWGTLEPVTPGKLSGRLKVCLDKVGYIKLDSTVTEAKTGDTYPPLEFVKGPVVDIDYEQVGPIPEINSEDYIPLLVLKENVLRWPLSGFQHQENAYTPTGDMLEAGNSESGF